MKSAGVFLWLFLTIICAYTNLRAQSTPKALKVNAFAELPKEIDGCAGYFYLSKADEKLSRYICVNDFGRVAFVKIGTHLQKFTLVKIYTAGKNDVYLYKAQSINLKIEIKSKLAIGDEDSTVTGTITVQAINGQKKSLDFIGEIGC